ncbi:MAG: hypothetical protein ACP5N7_02415 [Candidatus Pacearchaeota archaeon]
MEKQYNLSKRGATIVLIIIGLIGFVVINNMLHPNSPSPSQTKQVAQETEKPLEYKLAVINSKQTRPAEEMVNQFKDRLYKFSIVCPNNSQQNIADLIVKSYETITEKRPIFTLLQTADGIYTSIPKTNSSDCKEYVALYTQLVLKGF